MGHWAANNRANEHESPCRLLRSLFRDYLFQGRRAKTQSFRPAHSKVFLTQLSMPMTRKKESGFGKSRTRTKLSRGVPAVYPAESSGQQMRTAYQERNEGAKRTIRTGLTATASQVSPFLLSSLVYSDSIAVGSIIKSSIVHPFSRRIFTTTAFILAVIENVSHPSLLVTPLTSP